MGAGSYRPGKATTGVFGVKPAAFADSWKRLLREPVTPTRAYQFPRKQGAATVELLLKADAPAVAGQAFNCYDCYVAEQEVARIAKELSGSASEIADLNRGPKNQIVTTKLRKLGMEFGGTPLLRDTVAELIAGHRQSFKAQHLNRC